MGNNFYRLLSGKRKPSIAATHLRWRKNITTVKKCLDIYTTPKTKNPTHYLVPSDSVSKTWPSEDVSL